MKCIKIKKGLNLPILGEPDQKIFNGPEVKSVALVGEDYLGLKPKFLIQKGEYVKQGQPIFIDKKNPLVKYTSPANGKLLSINRGENRRFLSVEIAVTGNDSISFKSFSKNDLTKIDIKEIKENLIESGLWTSFRTRPFSKVPNPETLPDSIFINAMDTNPLSPNPDLIISDNAESFACGLMVLSCLGPKKPFVCKAPGSKLFLNNLHFIDIVEFSGPHPAGLSGTHIHFLDPVGRNKTAWYLNYQDVIAIGKLFTTGRIDVTRVISIAGSGVKNPRLIRTRLGANIDEVVEGELKKDQSYRIISGSVFSGRKSTGPVNFLGRYHNQISVIPEGQREFLGWQLPGFDKFSIKNVFASKLLPSKKFLFNTSLNGGKRAIMPIGAYEKVMPLNILPAFLLKALYINDLEEAEALGCLELDEEDLALCTFVCPGKEEYGLMLRQNLTIIEKEG